MKLIQKLPLIIAVIIVLVIMHTQTNAEEHKIDFNKIAIVNWQR